MPKMRKRGKVRTILPLIECEVFVTVYMLPQKKQAKRASMTMNGPEEVLSFWLDEVGPKGWYAGGEDLDRTISDRFSGLYDRACAGALSFELSIADQVVFVNAGSPGPADQDWLATSRSTATRSGRRRRWLRSSCRERSSARGRTSTRWRRWGTSS